MKSPDEMQELADICEERGDYKKASQLHEKALRLMELRYGHTYPGLETYLYNAGLVACALDQIAKSRTHFERLLELGQDESLLGEARSLLAAMDQDTPLAANL